MKYENFSRKKLQICVFFCNFVRFFDVSNPKKGKIDVQLVVL